MPFFPDIVKEPNLLIMVGDDRSLTKSRLQDRYNCTFPLYSESKSAWTLKNYYFYVISF